MGWHGTPFGKHRKWQFDPGATRVARRATTIMEHAKDSLINRDPGFAPDLPYDLTSETEDAIDKLNAAIQTVWAEHDHLQRAAERIRF